MARFRGTVQGQRGQASRLGGTKSGLQVNCHGWDGGVFVSGSVNEKGEDEFTIIGNGGSNGHRAGVHLLTLDHLGKVVWVNPVLATAARLQED